MHYENTLVNNYYDWAILGNHPNDVHAPLPWLKKIFYLELDLKKYSKWILSSFRYFSSNGMFFPTQDSALRAGRLSQSQLDDELYIRSHRITEILSMTDILNSQQGFERQYQNACNSLNITPVTDLAVEYYKDWRKFRVDPFL